MFLPTTETAVLSLKVYGRFQEYAKDQGYSPSRRIDLAGEEKP